MPIHRSFIFICFSVVCLCSACGSNLDGISDITTATASIPPLESSGTPSSDIAVAAAADLQFAFTDIAKKFEQETGHTVTLVFGSTGQLTQQIENGAPYDLLASADRAYVDRLASQGLILTDTVALYARGRIVLAVNRQARVNATELSDLTQEEIGHIAIANPAHAPYGLAAQQALQSAGLWDQLQGKLVYSENVRQTLQYVQTGDAEVGIISLSVADVPEITWTLIDDELHEPLDQALGVVASSTNQDIALQFSAYINGPSGRPIMEKYGFVLPDDSVLSGNPQVSPSATSSP